MPSRLPLREVTIGTDPELFLIDTTLNAVKSAIGIIPGTKEEPYPVEQLGDGYALQTDNILAEFNVPPCSINDKEGFVSSIERMKDYIRSKVKEVNPNLDLLCIASQTVAKSELKHPQAKQFGCDPDYCVYTMEQNKVKVAKSTQLRSAGFHIHIGYAKNEIDRSCRFLPYMDAFLGIPSVIIDLDTRRRELYGKAGCFRLQSYGVEYRCLSSFFLRDARTLGWVFDQTRKAIRAYNDCCEIPSVEEILDCMNNNNIALAKKLCQIYNLCADFLES